MIFADNHLAIHLYWQVAEKNSVGFMYDISDITSPKLAQVFHLSPASETKNPIVAYADRTLGEIDTECIIFLDESESPTGNPAIIFAGAFSTTTSFWEFECGTDETATTGEASTDSTTTLSETEETETTSDASSEPAPSTTASSYVPQIVRKDRSYYAYGYEGDTTEGAPNG